ncbi:CLUMA_CG007604, isoform A [Clunio marinus]|uniref:CLUMA_CG007604, isoform A n=1 Tax=Clunio marinus TaxID=568069 RepID=A0A1J1I6N8_9DIPT|nr:CLUMA_CG007604, isoform A [Clunio marinus]
MERKKRIVISESNKNMHANYKKTSKQKQQQKQAKMRNEILKLKNWSYRIYELKLQQIRRLQSHLMSNRFMLCDENGNIVCLNPTESSPNYKIPGQGEEIEDT